MNDDDFSETIHKLKKGDCGLSYSEYEEKLLAWTKSEANRHNLLVYAKCFEKQTGWKLEQIGTRKRDSQRVLDWFFARHQNWGARTFIVSFLRLSKLGNESNGRFYPFFKVPQISLKSRVRDQVTVTPSEVYEMADILKQERDGLWTLMIRLYFETGLRVTELVQLVFEDLDLTHCYLFARRKRGKRTRQRFSQATRDLFVKWLGDRGRIGIVFPPLTLATKEHYMSRHTVWTKIKLSGQLYNKARGVSGRAIHPHALRGSLITYLFDKGVKPKLIQKIAGHDDFSTTLRYDRTDDKQSEKVFDDLLEKKTEGDEEE